MFESVALEFLISRTFSKQSLTIQARCFGLWVPIQEARQFQIC